ncbi:MAG: ribosome-associated translation inhibitor RaiA [Candidatus Cloacimonetes bacterium]|nr:ribosome-associated translation inhibitor RaiA [Candidatus Cloacimonadota bacterium]
MQISITARHFDLTNAIRDHIYESCQKLERYFDHIITANFVLSLEKNGNKAELIVHAPKHNLICETIDKNMYLAIDNTVDKMEGQIKKLKGKWNDHNKKSLKDNFHFVYADLIERNEGKKRVKIKRILAESLTVTDALEKFDNIDDMYLVFKNLETDKVNVLVKKDKDHYKLIEA